MFRTRGIFRTLSNICDGAFCKNSYLAHIPASALKTFLYFGEWSFLALHFSYIRGSNFPHLKNEKIPLLKGFLYFRKWNFLAPSIESLLYFRNELANPKKQTKKPALKIFITSYCVFTIFTAVKHREIPFGAIIQHTTCNKL